MATCSDGVDNDVDGFIDLADPGCSDASDNAETAPWLVCDDGADNDGDGRIDVAADNGCQDPLDPSEVADRDGDGIVDLLDNCALVANPAQSDTDFDGIGNACDCDFDNADGSCSIDDFNVFLPDFITTIDAGSGTDMDGDGAVGIGDFNLFLPGFQTSQPGPSGLLSSPPSISNLQLSRTALPIPQPGQSFPLTVSFDFSDPDADIAQLLLEFDGPSRPTRRLFDVFEPTSTTGSGSRSLVIDDGYIAGTYGVTLQLLDATEQGSNRVMVAFAVDATVLPPIAITDLQPASGESGAIVDILGSGFASVAPEELRVSFVRGRRSAELVSVSSDLLTVKVPEGAASGPVVLETPLGNVQSPSSFQVDAGILIVPGSYEMLPGEQVDLDCITSGAPSSRVVWSIAGGDPAQGSIDAQGRYVAPPDLPPVNPVEVRCQSYDDFFLIAEAGITILPPPPSPGRTTILAQIGGEVFSPDREVVVQVPPGALGQDTDVTATILPWPSLPPEADDSVYAAAAEIGPPGLAFAQPVTVDVALRQWVAPGTLLPVSQLTETVRAAAAAAPIGTATVDATGGRASLSLTQTGQYLLELSLVLGKADAANQVDRIFDIVSFQMVRPRNTEWLEGLAIPVQFEPASGSTNGVGPFLDGVTAEATLGGVPIAVGPQLQPDATGWKLGTVLHIPILTDCGQGQVRSGEVLVRYPPATGTTDELRVPFAVDCLDELVFDGSGPPSPLPVNSYWTSKLGIGRLRFLPGAYRFSEVEIGANAELGVFQQAFLSPLRVEVTGDVRVLGGGAIVTDLFTGEDPQSNDLTLPCPSWPPGGHCGPAAGHFGAFQGGLGGDGGAHEGGRGGDFGNCSDCEGWGENGEHASPGGRGGKGGAIWEYANGFEAMFTVFDILTSLVQEDWKGVALSAYDLGQQTVKIARTPRERLRGTGRGGRAAAQRQSSVTAPPQGGGGGGGSGKARQECNVLGIDWCVDDRGSGGGGGGGGGHPLDLWVGGLVDVLPGGVIRGLGGPGGLGGGGFFHNSAPGGGGAGGNGAYIRIVAPYMINQGTLTAAGGLPGLSQFCGDPNYGGGNIGLIDGEYCDAETLLLIEGGIGEPGHDGVFDIQARLGGNHPVDALLMQSAEPGDPWRESYDFASVFPLLGDSDGDGLKDGLEVHLGTDPTRGDSDVDGLSDFEEVFQTETDPTDADSDDDALLDGAELAANPWVTDPLDADTDDDTISDGLEVQQGSDPTNADSTPEVCDGLDNDLDGEIDENCTARIDHKGTNFTIPFLPNQTGLPNPSLRLIITSDGYSDATVEYPAGTVLQTVSVGPDQPAQVTIPNTASTAWVPSYPGSPANVQRNAVRVRATFAVTVIAENKKAFFADRALALPNLLLGTEYRVMSWRSGPSQFAVVAAQAGTTQVQIDGLPSGSGSISVSLAAREGIFVSAGSDLSGVHITADKRVVVANGSPCATVGGSYCEHLYEIALPVDRWGTDYLARSNRNEDLQGGRGLERNYYRIMAAQDGTVLSVNGSTLAGSINAGDVSNLDSDDLFLYRFDNHISANRPILVSQFMSSICDEWPTDPSCTPPYASIEVRGDASMNNLVPTGSFPPLYRFTTAGSCGDRWTTAVNVIAPSADAQSGSILVDDVPVQPSEFTAFATAPQWSAATVELSCSTLLHTSESPNGHGLYLIGLGVNSAMTAPLGYDYDPTPFETTAVGIGCGLGFELALILPVLLWLRRIEKAQ